MLSTLKFAAKIVLGRVLAGRTASVLPDDTFLVSYPKSGNTWLRFLVASLRGGEADFATIEDAIPDIYQHADRHLLSHPRPRILKSHEYFDPRYPRVIYLVRDPRDVLVSYYHYALKVRKIDEGFGIDQFSDQFLSGELNRYGSWAENVLSWIKVRDGSPDFILIRYEDLLQDTVSGTARIADFLNWKIDPTHLRRAVRRGSAERMRKLEAEQQGLWKPIRHSRTDIPFVRRAKAESWRSELPQIVAQRVVDRWKDLMISLGYSQ